MASSSRQPDHIPYEDDEIIEAMSVEFDHDLDFLDREKGIHLWGILIADEEPGMGAVKATLVGIWKALGQIRITRAKKNIYSITVGSEKLARRLIDGCPWNVRGFCFTVKHWPLYQSLDDIEPVKATYWVQAHGIPGNQISISNGRKLGSLIGFILEVEDPSVVGNRGFLRVRIDLDARKPLPTGCRLPSSTITRKIRFQYENLKNFCYHCGRLGHMEIACRYPVNPLLASLGVVYDHNLVAESVHKSFSTAHHCPIEFPSNPEKRPFGQIVRPIPASSGGEVEPIVSAIIAGTASQGITNRNSPQGFSNGSSSQGGSLPQGNISNTFPKGKVGNTHGVHMGTGNRFSPLSPTERFKNGYNRKHLDMWQPDTNGTFVQNGSVTVDFNGISLGPQCWADPNHLPPWAFMNTGDFKRANDACPGPGGDDDHALVPAATSSVQILDFENENSLHDASKKRRAKKTVDCGYC
ncbi:hypothetical protein M0R45_023760 [Rubus argutus]|uniref:CCHC-type domain-containing protein n=1 Tax=Rubus argutus TaxID=59490 RepID=A0AAW1WSB5_RUBAR